jgi:hypothetical protein
MDPATPTDVAELEGDPLGARAAAVAFALESLETKDGPTIQRVRYTHDAMIDLIIARPEIHQNQLAKIFGFTPAWVSIVVNSDAFKVRLEQRKEELVDPTIRTTLQERFTAVTARSLEVLQEKLSKDASAIPDNLVLKAVELGSKALGLGGNAAPPPPPTDHLSALAERLLALQGRPATRPSEVLTYDERSAAFEPAHAQEPHPARPPAGESEATDVCSHIGQSDRASPADRHVG